MKSRLLLIIVAYFICFPSYSQQENYSRIRIQLNNNITLSKLVDEGILTDHVSKAGKNSIELELSATEILKLNKLLISYTVIVDDIEKNFIESNQEYAGGMRASGVCGLDNFTYGTMGHYHTYSEVLDQLDSMKILFPNLITSKDSVGHTIEGRAIYAIKISDNPTIDESSKEGVVYYDALHHAREPMSMEPLLYYMWWLLENYGTDEEATYLVNHRELHFIPVVNPDGYIYNQTISPTGGGMWRKNRRPLSNGEYGVDLNRNYSSQFGNLLGASSDPSSITYHGKSAFSEPESRAVRDYVRQIEPLAAFSCHSFGQVFIHAPGCNLPQENFESYAEFSSEFITNSFDGYGSGMNMISYPACGTTSHFIHDEGTICWTPEIGSSFWPSKSEFCSTILNIQPSFKYIAHISGSSPRLNDFNIIGDSAAKPGDTVSIAIRIKNRGLSQDATNVSVEVTPESQNIKVISPLHTHSKLNKRSFVTDTFKIVISKNALDFDQAKFKVNVKEGGFTTSSTSKYVTIGQYSTLFKDHIDSGLINWNSNSWDTTFISMQSGNYSIADSRYGNYSGSEYSSIIHKPKIDLKSAVKPILKFNAKWSLERLDFVYLQVSANGSIFATIKEYSEHQYWNQQQIDLSPYKGEEIQFRFSLVSDRAVQSDGFYFDDFKVVDYFNYLDPTTVSEYASLQDIAIYPNPSQGVINIDMRSYPKLDVKLYHCTGKLVMSKSITPNSARLDISSQAAGMYFITLDHDGKSITKRILLQ